MSKKISILFYLMVLVSIFISLYDIYLTVLTVDVIHVSEMNPIAKKIILYGKDERSYKGIAFLIWIKTLLLCIISSGTTMFHYSKSRKLNILLFSVCTFYFIENLIVLGVLTS